MLLYQSIEESWVMLEFVEDYVKAAAVSATATFLYAYHRSGRPEGIQAGLPNVKFYNETWEYFFLVLWHVLWIKCVPGDELKRREKRELRKGKF